MNNKTLLAIAAVLLAISLFSYKSSTTRAERFERGQKFLSQLNADSVHEIEIVKGETKVVLRKDDERFVVSSKNNYPAKNEAINRFITDTLAIELDKNVGSSDDLAKELEITGGEKSFTVTLRNDAGKDMVKFAVGKASEDGRGNYLKRLDGDDSGIYLSSKGVYLSSDADNFLSKEIVDVAAEKIASIQGGDYRLDDKDGTLVLANVPAGKKESSGVGQVKSLLAALSFDKVHLADEAEVSALNFDNRIKVSLKDNSSYLAELAQVGEKYYLKMTGDYDTSKLEGLSVGKEDTEEQLKEKSALLTRRDAIETFNNFHGSWVYELSSYTQEP